MKSGSELVEWVHNNYKAHIDHCKDWAKEGKLCYDFYAGHQLTSQEEAELNAKLRADIQFNRIRPMVSAVKGQQIANRQQIQYLPRTLGDARKNEVLTGAAKWVDDQCDAQDEITQAFEDLLITGMAALEMRVAYDEDMDGKIFSAERFSPFELGWDPSSPRKNLKGGKWRFRARWMDKTEAHERWPKLKDQEPGPSKRSIIDEPDAHNAAEAGLYQNDSRNWYNTHKDEVFVIQHQWWELVPFYRVQDPFSGQLLELSENKHKKMKDTLAMMGVKAVKQKKRVFYQTFVCGDMELESDDCPCPTHFSLFGITGYNDVGEGTFFGLVRGMMDPQKWSNKTFMNIEDIMTSNRAGGAFVEAGALADPRKAEEQWNEANPLIIVEDGAVSGGKIHERSPIPYPEGLDRMLTWAVQSLPAVTGINQEMMGYAERDQANVLELQRKKSALTVLADLFDSLSLFNKQRGEVLFYFMKTYINDGRLVRITNDEGEQYVPFQIDADTLKFDVIVDEAPTSPNQKQETFAVLSQVLPYFQKMGVAPPMETLDYVPLPASLVASWKKQIKPDGPPPPPSPEEQLEMAKMATEQSKVAMNQAKAEESKARALEAHSNAEAQALQNEAVRKGIVHPVDAQL